MLDVIVERPIAVAAPNSPWPVALLKFLALGVLFSGMAAHSAPPHRWTKYSPVPLSPLTAIVEGPQGYLWIGTPEEGLFRFDGFHLERVTQSPVRAPRSLAAIGDVLWITDDHRIAKFDGKFSEAGSIPEFSKSSRTDGTSLFVRRNSGWWRWSEGAWQELANGGLDDLQFDRDRAGWGIRDRDLLRLLPGENAVQAVATLDFPKDLQIGDSTRRAVRSSSGRVWLSSERRAVPFRDGKVDGAVPEVNYSRKGDEPLAIMGREGRVWLLGSTITSDPPGPVYRYQSKGANESILTATEGTRGDLWLVHERQGLIRMTPDSGWRVDPVDELENAAPSQVFRDQDSNAWMATDSGLFRSQGEQGHWARSEGPRRDYVEVLSLSDGRFLAASREEGLWVLDGEGRPVEQVADPLPRIRKDYRRIFRDRTGRIWVGNRRALFEAIAEGKGFRLILQTLPEASTFPSPIDFAEDSEGVVWVGYTGGLASLSAAGKWVRLRTDKPVNEVRTLSIDRTGNRIWVGYRKNGHFSMVERRSGRGIVTHFSLEEGYSPKDTHYLRVDRRGWIWRGSSDGVRVSDGKSLDPNAWLFVGEQNGLAGGRASPNGFFENSDGSVYLASGKGLTWILPRENWFARPQGVPRISQILVDGRSYGLDEAFLPETVPAGVSKLVARLGSFEDVTFRQRPFVFRLLPQSSEWATVNGAEVPMGPLVDGEYVLEVAYAGAGAGSAPAAHWRFRVGAEPMARWPYFLVAIGGAVASYLGLRRSPKLEKWGYFAGKWLYLRHHTTRGAEVADLVGELVDGRYRVQRVVRVGGTATVFSAEDLERDGAAVALKVLNARASESALIRKLFSVEVTALRSVSHRGVVSLLAHWIDKDGRPILVMPYINGPTLREWVESGPVSLAQRLDVLGQVAAALDAVHERGIVHRDVKPENILLDDGGRAYLIDFGIAGIQGLNEGSVLTEDMAGTLGYMGPERMEGLFSQATDTYSFGVVASELLLGKRLSEGDLFEEELLSLYGPGVAALLAAALSPIPGERPVRMREWVNQLIEAMGRAASIDLPAS